MRTPTFGRLFAPKLLIRRLDLSLELHMDLAIAASLPAGTLPRPFGRPSEERRPWPRGVRGRPGPSRWLPPASGGTAYPRPNRYKYQQRAILSGRCNGLARAGT